MNNPIIEFKELAIGAPFYIDAYPGTTYRKVSTVQAEFVKHRYNSAFNGHKLSMSPSCTCRRQPLDFDPNDLLGDEPVAKPTPRKKPATKNIDVEDLLK
jgi:hypothetical protein